MEALKAPSPAPKKHVPDVHLYSPSVERESAPVVKKVRVEAEFTHDQIAHAWMTAAGDDLSEL